MRCKDSKQHHVMFHELYSVSLRLCIAQNVRFEIPYKVLYFETPFLIIFKCYAWVSCGGMCTLEWRSSRSLFSCTSLEKRTLHLTLVLRLLLFFYGKLLLTGNVITILKQLFSYDVHGYSNEAEIKRSCTETSNHYCK